MTTRDGTDHLGNLDVLVGRWRMEASLGTADAAPFAETSFEWLEGRRFLIQRWRVDYPDAPGGIAIIELDEHGAGLRQHHFDSRGLARGYEISLAGGIWRLLRIAHGFSQRFTGISTTPTTRSQALGSARAMP